MTDKMFEGKICLDIIIQQPVDIKKIILKSYSLWIYFIQKFVNTGIPMKYIFYFSFAKFIYQKSFYCTNAYQIS